MQKSARWFVHLLIALFCLPAFLLSQQVSLTILHTNDTHGHLLPFSYPSASALGSDLAQLITRTDIGGVARRATIVKRLRDELGRKGTTVWLGDAGDLSFGAKLQE